MTREVLQLCTRYGVPVKGSVEYDRIYAFDAFAVPVGDIFVKYFNNRGGREGSMEKHVRAIRDAIVKKGSMGRIPPIIVDINTMMIADGNCRFDAVLDIVEHNLLDHLTLRVIFEDIPENEFDESVIEYNMGQQSWSLLDFIYNYSNRNFESFTKLIDFCDAHESLHSSNGRGINPRYGAAALRLPVNSLKKTSLTITDTEIEVGNKAVKEAADIRLLFSANPKANGGGWYEPYLRAWSEYRCDMDAKGIDFKDYLKEVKKSLKNRKSEVKVPYGSNKKQDWNGFFRTVESYVSVRRTPA